MLIDRLTQNTVEQPVGSRAEAAARAVLGLILPIPIGISPLPQLGLRFVAVKFSLPKLEQ